MLFRFYAHILCHMYGAFSLAYVESQWLNKCMNRIV